MEQRWLGDVAARIDVAVPKPVLAGAPTSFFPWPWSLVPWIPGRTADTAPLDASEATRLADVLRAVHTPAPADAPTNPFRGLPLTERADAIEERLARLGFREFDDPWSRAVAAPPSRKRRWIHGDLHERNVLTADGRLAGILDWGDMTGGDIANDLAAAWLLFDTPAAREIFLDVYGASVEARARAVGWAINFASASIDGGDERHVAIGHTVRRRLIQDFG